MFTDPRHHWQGCSYSFESALTKRGFVPRHAELGCNVSMYKTTVPLLPAGSA